MTSSLPIVLFLLPFLAALIVVAAGWWLRSLGRWLAPAALLATSVLAFIALVETRHQTLRVFLGAWAPPLGIEWSLDFLGALMICLVASTSALVLIGAGHLVHAELEQREVSFYACTLLFVSGLIGMLTTADLFNFYVHLEVAALSAYALVGAGGSGAPRAAIRYLILGTLGASLYLVGIGFFYAATGSLNMADVASRLATAPRVLTTTGSFLVLIGLGLKMGLVPLHAWMPDAYAKAPAASAALMAPLMTKVSAFALLRIFHWVCAPHDPAVLQTLAFLGAVTILYAGLRAALEQDLRRALALSSISQVGLVAIGIGLDSSAALTGAIIHLIADALAKAALFLAAGSILVRYDIRDIRDLGRVRSSSTAERFSIVLAGLSLVGLPPFIGFFGKWYVLTAALDRGAIGLAVTAALGTLLTAALVFRILQPLFFGTGERAAPPVRSSWSLVAATCAFALSTSILGFVSAPVLQWIAAATLPKGG
jgi:multicomponent Na+:H+ antiporter subunit D